MKRTFALVAILSAISMLAVVPAAAERRATLVGAQGANESVFYIAGYIRNAGSYRLEPDMTVGHAISLAGGITSRSDEHGVTIARIVEGRRVKLAVSVDALVLPNDLIQIG